MYDEMDTMDWEAALGGKPAPINNGPSLRGPLAGHGYTPETGWTYDRDTNQPLAAKGEPSDKE